ncbi:MAG: hypothetical protein IKU09_04455 [Firmicutes bacterium]|nr:hypothetical protein [Bacillota bacterium]
MSKGTIFYAIGFVLIVLPMMVNRYLVDIPNLIYYVAVIGGFVCIYIGMRIKGEKINWNYDFSPKGTTAQSRRNANKK